MPDDATPFYQRLYASFPEDPDPTRGILDYRGQLRALAEIIKPQLPKIRALFPEYTAHDWDGHIRPLFDLAARLFGADTLLALGPVDRFLLAVGLDAHDWGMAVGPDEALHLAQGAASSVDGAAFTPIDGEPQKLRAFCRDAHLAADAQGHYPALADRNLPHLAEYIRRTHAWRSGARVRRHFLEKTSDDALAESAAMVCIGHWLDFAQLRDATVIKTMRMVGNAEAHPLLVALLVRLTDLFDLGRDRTPYAMRRFIGPRDPRSIKEWDKHKALDPAGCEILPNGDREIYLGGTCSDPDLWPDLLNLRTYCEDQLRQAVALLAEEHARCPQLRLHPVLDWRVETHGFDPRPIRFEFDRTATFRLLSQEIYGGEPHIFLRELLQNAIDASRQLIARCAQHGKLAVPRPEDLLIHFHIERPADGRILVRCRDHGIGMNRHIIAEYLARVGASYYRSEEFLRDEVKMDAISRFGIGLLSVFMVAESFEVKTRRPREFGGDDHTLQVKIPGLDRHFHVRPLADEDWQGTEITLEVLPQKLAQYDKPGNKLIRKPAQPAFLDPIGYLSFIAGFVEFPIYIEDGTRRILVLHPQADRTLRPPGVPAEVEVSQIDGAYPWDEVVETPKTAPERAHLGEQRIDMRDHLDPQQYEGFLSVGVPCSVGEDWWIKEAEPGDKKSLIVELPSGTRIECAIKQREILGASGKHTWERPDGPLHAFQDGIWVHSSEAEDQYELQHALPPNLWFNRRGQSRNDLSVSRREFTRGDGHDSGGIARIVLNHYASGQILRILAFPSHQRPLHLVWLASVFRLETEWLVKQIPVEDFPLLVLDPEGRLFSQRTGDFIGENGWATPLSPSSKRTGWRLLKTLHDHLGSIVAPGYHGARCAFGYNSFWDLQSTAMGMRNLVETLQRVCLRRVALRWIQPLPLQPAPGIQEKWAGARIASDNEICSWLQKLHDAPETVSDADWFSFRTIRLPPKGDYRMQKCVDCLEKFHSFPAPFANAFAYEKDYLNRRHPAALWLLRAIAGAALEVFRGQDASKFARELGSWCEGWFGFAIPERVDCYDRFAEHWEKLHEIVEGDEASGQPPVPPCPAFSEWVPNSFPKDRNAAYQRKQAEGGGDLSSEEPWGYEITEWPPKKGRRGAKKGGGA